MDPLFSLREHDDDDDDYFRDSSPFENLFSPSRNSAPKKFLSTDDDSDFRDFGLSSYSAPKNFLSTDDDSDFRDFGLSSYSAPKKFLSTDDDSDFRDFGLSSYSAPKKFLSTDDDSDFRDFGLSSYSAPKNFLSTDDDSNFRDFGPSRNSAPKKFLSTDDDSDFRGDIARLREDFADLQAVNKNLAKTLKEEQAKNAKHRKKHRQFIIDNQLSKHVLEKNLSAMRNFIHRNIKHVEGASGSAGLNSELPESVEFNPQRKSLRVDLEFTKIFCVKSLTDDKVIVPGVLAVGEDLVLVFLNNGVRTDVKLYNVDDPEKMDEGVVFPHFYIGAAVIPDSRSFVSTNGVNIKTWPMDYLQLHLSCVLRNQDSTEVKEAGVISAVTCVNSTTFAVAGSGGSKILLVSTEGKVCKVFERYQGFFNFLSRMLPPPILDMCVTREDSLIFCDSTGIHRLNALIGTFTLVSEIKTVVSLAAYTEGYFFALDGSSNRILLFGSQSTKVIKRWSLGSQLREGDRVRQVSVFGDRLVCLTSLGFVLALSINYEEIDN